MRVFQRNDKFYVGPMSDQAIDRLLMHKELAPLAGIACRAAGHQVDTYVTLPIDRVSRRDIEGIGMGMITP